MTTVGIIAEYNPFHNGHAYQIAQARALTGCDRVIVCMSGNFTQRGTPALLDKYTRARMALENGADLIIELPAVWSSGSAEYFATAGVRTLLAAGTVDYLCFGVETARTDLLGEAAVLLADEPEEFRLILSSYLDEGLTFPRARVEALAFCIEKTGRFPDLDHNELTGLLSSPNTILGIEYLKALLRFDPDRRVSPLPILRSGSGYKDDTLFGPYSSATAIRNTLHTENDGRFTALAKAVPAGVYDLLSSGASNASFVFPESLDAMLEYRLLALSFSETERPFADVNPDLFRYIINHVSEYTTREAFLATLTGPLYTTGRISRSLLHMLFDLHQDLYDSIKSPEYRPYIRVLGMKKDAGPLLSAISRNASSPVLVRVADDSAGLDALQRSVFEKDLFASALYEHLKPQRNPSDNEFTRALLKV